MRAGAPLAVRLLPVRGLAGGPETQWQAAGGSNSSATWQPLGPTAVETSNFGLVTGRVAALALDPSDATGNRLYVGTTGGGVWVANNAAATPSSIVFTPLTDNLAALGGAVDASISIGALTVQPGGTGVILAGTGDPNDVLDSYYGAGILRSTDGGNTWSLIQMTVDAEDGFSAKDVSFVGNGFAGFAWSTANPQIVVAAVSQAYESTQVDANRVNESYEGLYYSSDSGATWHLATITDGSGSIVQGPLNTNLSPNGNAATAVVWNPVRQIFMAAVRYHGYYQSADGITWTRMTAQPGAGLTTQEVPNELRDQRLHRLPYLSRRAGRESANRRHVCLDGGFEQPGPGTVAGSVRDQRRQLHATRQSRLPSNGILRRLKPAPSKARRRLPTETTTWRWPQCPRSKTRWCWRGRTTYGSAAWPWAACGGTPPTPPPA